MSGYWQRTQALCQQWSVALADKCDDPIEIEFGGVATEAEVEDVEAEIGRPLPPELRWFFLSCSSRIVFDWYFGNAFADTLPDEFVDTRGGCVDVDLRDQSTSITNWAWADCRFPCFSPNGDARYEFADVYPFMQTVGGDTLLMVTHGTNEGSVLLHEFEDLGLQCARLAPSFLSFLSAWSSLGCPGPRSDNLMPFYDREMDIISATGDAATRWKHICGLGDDKTECADSEGGD